MVLVGFIAYVFYQIAMLIKSTREVVGNFRQKLLLIDLFKSSLKAGILGFLSDFLLSRKGGGNHDR